MERLIRATKEKQEKLLDKWPLQMPVYPFYPMSTLASILTNIYRGHDQVSSHELGSGDTTVNSTQAM